MLTVVVSFHHMHASEGTEIRVIAPPLMGKRSIVISRVCWSVRLTRISKTTSELNSPVRMLPMAVGLSYVARSLVWRIAIRYVHILPVLWITSCFPTWRRCTAVAASLHRLTLHLGRRQAPRLDEPIVQGVSGRSV